ncbi:MAG: SPFH/Band 7/PHB domain protein [Candidatus Yonathbacteria bacterium]|nr:SPFH/Band 7/PHB domain protein [Candidatus Yonathbacteria bacterium]
MVRFYLFSVVSVVLCVVAQLFGYGLGTPLDIVVATALVLFWFGVGGVNIVNEWARRPVLRLGKYRGEVGPGFVWINPAIEWPLTDVIIRDTVNSIKLESVQTKDNVPLGFLLVLTTRVTDVRKSVVEVSDFNEAIAERAKAAANSTIRAHNLGEILGLGLSFSEQILKSLQEKIESWGVKALAVEIKDFKIADTNIEQAISMRARAQKEGEAELVRAEMQEAIALQLNKAADALDAEGWHLKGLETLLELCRSANNNTILVPTELLQSLTRAFAVTQQK